MVSHFALSDELHPRHISFAVSTPGSPPFAYLDKDKKHYLGISRDFFNELELSEELKVMFVDSNRSRSELYAVEGKVDVFLSNPLWLDNPSSFITSEIIMPHNIYLYSTSPFDEDFTLSKLANKRVCTRTEFIYSGLSSYFADKTLIRVDASSQISMANMLFNQRCDYAIMNEFNAAVTYSSSDFCHKPVYQSPLPTSSVDLVFVMRPALHWLKDLIDKQLAIFKESGQLANSLSKHTQGISFPKLAGGCL